MYLRCNRRFKDGKGHYYWNIVESKRCAGGKVVQRQVLYLGEINDSQREAWCRSIEAFDEQSQQRTQLALFPADRELPEYAKGYGVQVRLGAMELHRPRQWGACWLACHLYEELALDEFWAARLPDSREGTRWRHIGMVFQSYAIWPHLNVFQNVAFPLRVGRKKPPRREVKKKVERALSLVHMEGFEERPATRLSGGQQQRVALARALVGQPKLLLLDEPLSNLDAKLREGMRVELRQLQRSLGLTTLYVTHDQTEALAMSDKIAIMRDGKIMQLGSPKEIYERPVDPFTINFVGSTNLIAGTVQGVGQDGLYTVETQKGPIQCIIPQGSSLRSRVLVSIRHEDLHLHPGVPSSMDHHNIWSGEVRQLVYLGEYSQCEVEVGKGIIMMAKVNPPTEVRLGQKVYLSFDPHRCVAVKSELE